MINIYFHIFFYDIEDSSKLDKSLKGIDIMSHINQFHKLIGLSLHAPPPPDWVNIKCLICGFLSFSGWNTFWLNDLVSEDYAYLSITGLSSVVNEWGFIDNYFSIPDYIGTFYQYNTSRPFEIIINILYTLAILPLTFSSSGIALCLCC